MATYHTQTEDTHGVPIPKDCQPRYELLEGYLIPLTRKDVLYHLWFVADMPEVNIFKEGPVYAMQVGRVIINTGIRCLRNASTATWEEFVKEARRHSAQAS